MIMKLFHQRRNFLKLSCGSALISLSAGVHDAVFGASARVDFPRTTFSFDRGSARFYSEAVAEPVKILQISDVHLFIDDERDAEYRQYSERMSKAYNKIRHFKTGKETNPQEALLDIAQRAKAGNFDALALTGDIVSFPSSAGVDYVLKTLSSVSSPFFYTAGNHDWHFEGMKGAERKLRDEWIAKRLTPLYPTGVNPLAYSVRIKGIKCLFIDDSIYEILPSQLEFLEKELSDNVPSLLFMHIPIYAPGRSVGYGVAHPDWNADHDKNYQIERRPRWPESGHTSATYSFRTKILEAPNLLGIFTGHIHADSLDVLNGKPSSVVRSANDGSTLKIEIFPYPSNNR